MRKLLAGIVLGCALLMALWSYWLSPNALSVGIAGFAAMMATIIVLSPKRARISN